MKLYFNQNGTASAVNDSSFDFTVIGQPEIKRASHVWPVHPVKRLAFRVLRSLFGERGRTAEWCRRWRGPWEVRFADSPRVVAFTHKSRRVCIAWEVMQLNLKLANANISNN